MKIKISYFLFMLCASILFMNAQDSLQTKTQIGGLNRYDSIPPKILEDANLRVWYEFTQNVKYENEIKSLRDTMVLVTGNQYSLYYDWSRETKYKKMLSQLDAAKKTTKFINYNSYFAFIEKATQDDQLFEFTPNRDNSEILKDRKQHLLVTTDLDDADIVNEKLYLLEENIPPQTWQFHDETQEVMGYICQKATAKFKGRDYTAWYTLDIPVNDGPFKFYGLPGLILMVEDSDKQFHFKVVGLEQLSNAVIISEIKKDYIKCTKEQYEKIKRRMQETVFLYYSQGETLYVSKKRIPVEYSIIEID